jgi:hypothetical protein
MMSNELEGMCKEAVVAYIKVISRNLPDGAQEKHEKSQSR